MLVSDSSPGSSGNEEYGYHVLLFLCPSRAIFIVGSCLGCFTCFGVIQDVLQILQTLEF